MSPSPCAGMDRLVQDVLLSQAGEIAGTLLGKWRGLGQVGFGLFGAEGTMRFVRFLGGLCWFLEMLRSLVFPVGRDEDQDPRDPPTPCPVLSCVYSQSRVPHSPGFGNVCVGCFGIGEKAGKWLPLPRAPWVGASVGLTGAGKSLWCSWHSLGFIFHGSAYFWARNDPTNLKSFQEELFRTSECPTPSL